MHTSFRLGFEKMAGSFAEKRTYRTTPIGSLDPDRDDEVWSAKIDGAHSVVQLEKGKTPRLFSHRISKRTGDPIEYTAKLPHIQGKSPFTATMRAETYAVTPDGRAVAPDVVTALLNSGQERSLALQKDLGIQTRTALIDVDTFRGKDVSAWPFEKKQRLMHMLVKRNPDFVMPDTAGDANSKSLLLKAITTGQHPQTKEGIIAHRLGVPGAPFTKAKVIDHHDVHIVSIFPESGARSKGKPMAGGFEYAWEAGGTPVGRVGTGFSHAMKKDMWDNPDKYIGLVAKVKALDISKKKVLQKPSFSGWHPDKNVDKEIP